jgi:hypothetical protein
VTDDLENVGGIGITLGIKDDTEKSLEAIHARLEAIAKEWTATVKIEDASGKGGPTPGAQAGVEAKAVSAAFATGISKFTAAFENFTIKIDPASITSIASAIREALQQSGTNYSPTGRNAFADASQRATTGSASVVRTGVSSGMVDATRNATWQNNMYRVELRALNAGGTSAPQRIGFATPLERTQAVLEGQPMAPGRRRRPLAEGEEAVPAYSISAKVRSRGPHYKPPSAGLRERGAPVPVADSEKMETYRGVEVVRQASVRSSGRGRRRVGAKLDPRTGRILVDDAMLRAQYENKGWRDMAELSDSSKASPLPDELFPNYSKYRGFVLEHEYQHGVSPRRAPGETMGKYEDRINQAAIAAGSARTVKPRYSSRGAHWKPIPGMELGGTSQARLDAEASARAIWESEQTSGVRRVGPVESDYRDSFGEELVDRLTVGNAANRSPVIPRAFRDRTPLGRKFLPSILKAISDAERSDEETGQIATSYRIPAHQLGHIDMSKVRVPNKPEATVPEKRTYLQELRIPAHAQAIEDFFERNPLASRDNPRLDEGIDVAGAPLLRGVRLERITRPVRFLEELTKSLRAQGERVDMDTFVGGGASENPQMKALYALAQDTVSRFPTRAASPKQGAGFLNQVPPDPIPLDQTPQMMLKKSIWAKTEQLRRYWGRRKTRGDQRKAGGRTGQSGQFIDRAAAIWLRNITRGQAEEGDLRWDEKGNFLDPGMVDLANQFFLYKLGPSQYRAPEYADTTRYPEVSAPDMHAKLYGTRAVSSEPETVWRRDPKKVLRQAMGLEPSIDPETGKPTGVNSWLPKRPSPRGRVLGLYRSVAQKFDRVPPMYRAALGAVRGELSELYGSRRAKQDADLVTTRSPLRWSGSSVVQERALRDQAREERRIFGRDTKAYGLGEPDYKFLQNLPTEITGGLRETAAIKERDRADKAYAEWKGSGAERAGNPPPRPAQWSPPAYTTGTGESMPWHLLSAEQKRKARPARDAEGRREHADLPLGEREGRRARIHLTKDNQTRVEYPFGQTEEETEAARIGLLRQATAYPTTSHFKGKTAKLQRAARYDVAVAQTELDRTLARIDDLTKEERLAAVPTFEAEVGPQEDVQHREMFRRTGRFQDPNYRSPLTRRERRLGQAQLSGRYAATFREQREEYVRERPLSIEEEISSWHAQQKAETKLSWKENLGIRQPTLEDEMRLQGQMVVLGHQRKRLTDTAARAAPGTSWADIKTQAITGRDRGIPRNPLPSVVETMAAVESGEVHPDLEAAQATAGAPPRRLHRRRAAPESFVAAGGPGGPSAGTPGGGMVSVSGVVDVRIVDSIALTIANPTALRPEKVAAAATGTAAATTAAKTPAVPEGATAYGPKEARPVVAAGPVDKRGETIRMLGEVLPAARQAERAAGTARGARQKNLRAGGRASLTGMQMQQTAEAAVQKEEADAKAAADKARAAEAKRFAALPFSKRVEEVAQKHLEDLRNSSTYMPPATGVAAAPIRPFNPATSAVEERGARLLAMREELAPLGLRPSEIEDRTWTDKARALAAQHAPGTREPWRPALVRGTIKREFKKNVIAKGVKDEWGPGDEEAFYSRIFTDAGIADLPAPPRAPGTARTPMAARAMGADKQLTNAMRRLGITPAPVDQEKAARGLEYPNEEGGEPLDPYEFLRRNVATAQSKRGELSSRALSTMGVQYVGRKFGPWGRIHQREVELTAATTKAKGEVGEYKTLRGEYEAQAPIVMGLRTSARAPGATAEDKASFVELRRRFLDLGKATHAQAKVANDAVMAQAELSAKITTTGDTVQHFGASFAGGVVGGFVGAMAGMIAQPLIQGVSQAVAQIGGPIVDSLLGWQMTQAKTTGAISQTTQAQAGFGQAAVAAQYQTISPTLLNAGAGGQAGFNAVGEQSRVMAANEKLVAYRDYLRTKKNIGTGATPALTEASGGILGGWIGAERKHTAEVINSMVPDLGRVEATKTINELLGGATGKPEYQFRETEATGYEASNPDVRAQWAWEQANGMEAVAGNRMVLVDAAGNIVSAGKAASAFASSLTSATKAVDKTNPEEYIRANENQIQAQIGGLEAQKQYTLDTSIPMQRGMNWLTSPQLPFGTSWMPGTQGNTPGFPSPTLVDQYSKEMQPFVGEAQGKVGAIPAGLGPMGYTFEGGLEASKYKIPADATQSFNQYKQVGQSAFKAVQDAAEAGIQTMLKAGVPAATINSLREYGAQAIALQSAIAAVQVGRSETKYQHDLAIANRALGDARQLTGQIGKNNSDNVGYYERQLLLINRASTALSLQLQQRSITTQMALAQFSVPGETGEERYARRQEKEIEAGIAQQQLNLSKQAFGTEIKLVDATNMRQLKDTAYALSDLKLDRQAALFTAGLQNALALVQAAVESITPEVAAYTGFFDSINSLQREMAVQIAAITGANVKTMITTVEDAIAGLVSRFPWLFGTAGITANAPSQAPGGEHSGTSGEQTPRPEDSRYRPGTAPVAPRYGPRDRAIWGARLGITPKSAAGGRGADMGNPSAGYAFPNPVAVTTTTTTNNNQKVEVTNNFNVDVKNLSEEQVRDFTTQVVKNINTALSLVGLRPVAN